MTYNHTVVPSIRFCTGFDGRRIAYAVHGSGPPLVCAPWWVSHLEADWSDPPFRAFFSALGEHSTVVRYDRPGVGLSDRDRAGFDFEQQVRDLEAVVAHAALDRLALLGISCGGPPCVRYAAAHPERVTRLVLFGSYVRGSDIAPAEVRQALTAFVRASWDLGARTLADLFAPELSNEEVRNVCRRQRVSASPEAAANLLELTFRMDVAEAVGSVSVPTLVLHRRGDRTVPFERGRALAAAVPGATLVPLDGTAHVPWRGNATEVATAIDEFLRGRVAGPAEARQGEFRHAGDLWSIDFAGRRVHLKDAKGLTDLAMLLANPGRDISATELVQGGGAPLERPSSVPAVDERALRSYRRRLTAVREELMAAEEGNDLARIATLRAEAEQVEDELRSVVGLGGRPRNLNDPADRARKAVSGRVRAALAKISEVHPELGAHLEASITTGNSCRYSPDPPVSWWT